MKKYILLFAAGGVLTLASCGGNETKTEDLQEHIDSSVNAKVEDMSEQMKAQNDSTIAAMAKAKADSMAAAAEAEAKAKGGTKTTVKKTTTKTTKPVDNTPPPPPPPPAKSEKELKLEKMRNAAKEGEQKTQEEIQKGQESKKSKLDKMRGN